MILLKNVTLHFGPRTIFDDLSVSIKDNDKIGLVGRNGAGKSTLFKVLSREQIPDHGLVEYSNISNLAYLKQHLNFEIGINVIDQAMTAFDSSAKIDKEIDELNEKLAVMTDYQSPEYAAVIDKITSLSEQLAFENPELLKAEAERFLKGLGFKQHELNQPMETFSGGWQMRVELAKLLLTSPDVLLLDEPTNFLDIESILWLEGYLEKFNKALIVVSHDQEFLDNATKKTIEVVNGSLFEFAAPYTKAMVIREQQREILDSASKNQEKMIAEKQRLVERFKAKASKTSMAQSIEKQIAKIKPITTLEEDNSAMAVRFLPPPRSGEIVIDAKDIAKSFGEKKVLDGLSFQIMRGEKVALVGQNGQGKSTISKLIMHELELTRGSIEHGHNTEIGIFHQNQTDFLDGDLTVLETLENASPANMRTKLRSILGSFLFSGEDVDKKVKVLSGGEKTRLALAEFLLTPYNLMILDEPTNHLDISSKTVLKDALKAYEGALLIISHDRFFLKGLADKTLEVRDGDMYTYLGGIEYFLEKRGAQNLREVEKKTKQKKEVVQEKPEISDDELKKLKRQLQYIERDIEKLENKKTKLEVKMGVEDFYTSNDSADVIKKYDSVKVEIVNKNEEWEKLAEKLILVES